jgi:hypothetical protein
LRAARRLTAVQRRRRVGLGAIAALALIGGVVAGAGGGGGPPAPISRAVSPVVRDLPPAPAALPRGGRRIFPAFRVVAYYGAPQAAQLGTLGIGTPEQAARRLLRTAGAYAKRSRPVLPAMELLASIADRTPGPDGAYRTRQSPAVIARYLRAARGIHALLVLDLQPGHSDFLTETKRLERWLREPDVGLALDPEWHTPGHVPGQVIGSVSAAEVNAVSRYVSAIVRARRLPQKLFVVHQFTASMIEGKPLVAHRRGLAITMNVDGFGTPSAKVSKYDEFTHDGTRFDQGFKVFFHEDTNMLSPREVLQLQPPPDLIVYE